MRTGLRRAALRANDRRQAQGQLHHLKAYPSHDLLPELGRTFCIDCDAWIVRPRISHRVWRRLPQ